MSKKQNSPAIKFWTPLRIVSSVIVLGLFAAFGVSSCNSNDPQPVAPVSVRSTSGANRNEPPLATLPPFVFDAEMKGLNGESIKLSKYSGKVLLINLWATWCGPCRTETPELVRLHKEYQARGVEMVGLSTEDPGSSKQMVQDFVREYEVDYEIGWVTRDVAMALMQGQGSIPQSFILTRDGRVKKRFIGFHPQRTPPQLKQAIEEALLDNS